MDQLLRQSGTIKKLSDQSLMGMSGSSADDGFVTRAMDSNDLEKERGTFSPRACLARKGERF